ALPATPIISCRSSGSCSRIRSKGDSRLARATCHPCGVPVPPEMVHLACNTQFSFDMNRLTVTLLLLSALQVALMGQWQRQYPLSKLENVVDIDLTQDGHGVAVGANATVLTKSAGGTEWFLRPEPVSGWDLAACDVAEGQNGQYMAVGGPG